MKTLILLFPLFVLSGFCSSCLAVTEHLFSDPKHSESVVERELREVFDGIEKTRDDIRESLRRDDSERKGRVFVHIREDILSPEVVEAAYIGISNLMEDEGYEIIPEEEIRESIRSKKPGNFSSRGGPFAEKAARVMSSYEGVGALDIVVKSSKKVGLGKPGPEGKYREKVTIKVEMTFYRAKFADEVFRDKAKLVSKSEYKQRELYWHNKISRLDTGDRTIYQMLLSKVRALLPRFPERDTY